MTGDADKKLQTKGKHWIEALFKEKVKTLFADKHRRRNEKECRQFAEGGK